MFFKKKQKRIYLDYASITPIDEDVLRVMDKYSKDFFANPSALYSEGLLAKEKVEESRQKIAKILNAQKSEIVFTSGGTEGNNTPILGVFEKAKREGTVPHIITTTIEHPSILEICAEIEHRGGEVTYLKVSGEGLVSPKDVNGALKKNTILVSVSIANSEIGTIQPIKEIGKVIKEYRQKKSTDREGGSTEPSTANVPYFHTDASQAAAYLPLDVKSLGVDLMTLDGIKIYGPRGIGVLYVKSGVKISPIIFGGGQEGGLRSGTENVPAVAGLALALEKCQKEKEKELERLLDLRDYAIDLILENFPDATLNGSRDDRLPNNINICFPGLDAEFAVIKLDHLGIATSYSSSCRNLKGDSSSYVVEELDKKDCKSSSLRFTLGRGNVKSHIDTLVLALRKIIKHY